MSKIRNERLASGLCVMCGRFEVKDRTECDQCRLRRSTREKARYKQKDAAIKKSRREKIADQGLCTRCKQPCDRKTCVVCLEKQKRKAYAMKDLVYEKYGGYVCKCCGESTKEFLTLDHVNNDGAKHRRELGKGVSHLYRWIIKNNFPPIFEVMCYNCNCGRRFNGGVCPHKANGRFV